MDKKGVRAAPVNRQSLDLDPLALKPGAAPILCLSVLLRVVILDSLNDRHRAMGHGHDKTLDVKQ